MSAFVIHKKSCLFDPHNTKTDLVTGQSPFRNVITSGESNSVLFVGKCGIKSNLWCCTDSRAQVDIGSVAANVLLEFSGNEATLWGKGASQN